VEALSDSLPAPALSQTEPYDEGLANADDAGLVTDSAEQPVDAAAVMSHAELMQQHAQHSDCGIVGQRQRFKSQLVAIAAASPQDWESDAEAVMQVGWLARALISTIQP
jgi:hypothetical protein